MKKLARRQAVESLSVHIEGKVQGVGFRAATVRQAHELGIGGWVRNLSDGRVQALIQGDHAAVDRMLSWFLQGPPAAHVKNVTHEDVATERFYERFEQI